MLDMFDPEAIAPATEWPGRWRPCRRRRSRHESGTRWRRGGRSPVTWSLDAQVMARLKPLLPTPVFDRSIARAMDFPKPPDADSSAIALILTP